MTDFVKMRDALIRLKEVINDLHDECGHGHAHWMLVKAYDHYRQILFDAESD